MTVYLLYQGETWGHDRALQPAADTPVRVRVFYHSFESRWFVNCTSIKEADEFVDTYLNPDAAEDAIAMGSWHSTAELVERETFGDESPGDCLG